MEWICVSQSECNPCSPRTRPTEFCSPPVLHQSNLGLIELFWAPHPYISSTRSLLFSICGVCVCVCACVRVHIVPKFKCLVVDWYFWDAIWISRWTNEAGETKIPEESSTNSALPLLFSFPPCSPSSLPSIQSLLFSLLRMWSRLSSSLVPRSSRRLCWCWTSWRSMTGTSSPSSRQSSPATRSSSTS